MTLHHGELCLVEVHLLVKVHQHHLVVQHHLLLSHLTHLGLLTLGSASCGHHALREHHHGVLHAHLHHLCLQGSDRIHRLLGLTHGRVGYLRLSLSRAAFSSRLLLLGSGLALELALTLAVFNAGVLGLQYLVGDGIGLGLTFVGFSIVDIVLSILDGIHLA